MASSSVFKPLWAASQQQQQHYTQQRQQPPPWRGWRQQWRQQWRQRSGGRGLLACSSQSTVTLYDLYNQQIPYKQAWDWQKQLVEQVSSSCSCSGGSNSSEGDPSGSSDSSSGTSGSDAPLGSLLLLQHPPVYTLGTGSTEGHLKFDAAAPPLPLYRTERGGEVTYHGPGQLVMYPILPLRRPPFQPDLHWYMRSLEEVVIRALDAVSGLQGERIPGLTGVWVDGAKVAAMGVRASRWVTYHGLALNVTADLTPFRQIVPCGIGDRPVASVQGLLAAASQQRQEQQAGHGLLAAESDAAAGAAAAGTGVLPGVAAGIEQQGQTDDQLLEEYRHGLLDAFQDVFGVQLVEAAAGIPATVTADGRPPLASAQ